ncbi:DNA-binding protein [Tilletiaria anomala UBC 951]|uniref:DNA-binding protein n=1 Tax=Tilletiaria anomala (strain ATCC 24038 / CBS 436.72 / UBC 951) TaxID=1037660 RepID=A0A066WBS4_TILAU|nr:DNA-binding protein [Tilletiaria anomala UBC 951]KDN51362.1 DNA-binding protein [Tilletiaria anomala UBC 951]
MASTSRVTLEAAPHAATSDGGLFGLAGQHGVHPPLNFTETVQALTEFIEVAIHTVLCVRGVYPPEVFTRKKRYATPVWQARHPGLSAYIGDAVKAARRQIILENVQSVVLLVSRASDPSEALERFVFRIAHLLPVPPPRDRDLDIQGNLTLPEVELALRAMMQKIMALDGDMAPYPDPDDVTCAIIIECMHGKQPQSDDPDEPPEGPWVPASAAANIPTLPTARQQGADEHAPGAYTLPIKALDTGVINLLFYAQEHITHKQQDDAPERASSPQNRHARQTEPGQSDATAAAATKQGNRQTQLRGSRSECERDRVTNHRPIAAPSQRSTLLASQQKSILKSRTAPMYRDAERDIDQHSKLPLYNDDDPSESEDGGARRKGGKRKKRGRNGVGGGGDRSRAYGAAMGVRSGGGVQNSADIGDTEDESSEPTSDRSVSSRGTDGGGAGGGGAGGSDNEMTSVAGIGFGGPAKAAVRPGW